MHAPLADPGGCLATATYCAKVSPWTVSVSRLLPSASAEASASTVGFPPQLSWLDHHDDNIRAQLRAYILATPSSAHPLSALELVVLRAQKMRVGSLLTSPVVRGLVRWD